MSCGWFLPLHVHKTLDSIYTALYFCIYIYLFVCMTGQMCVALDSIHTVALDGKRSLEEINALFVSVRLQVSTALGVTIKLNSLL